MKKKFAKITVGIIMMLACCMSVSCEPAEALVTWPNKWYLENVSESKIFYRFDDTPMQALSPGEITLMFITEIPYKGEKRTSMLSLRKKVTAPLKSTSK